MKNLILVAVIRDLIGSDYPIRTKIGSDLIIENQGNLSAIADKFINDNYVVDKLDYVVE